MYRQRLSNPYAGLSEGIQDGLSTLADSQVKLAQIQNDRQIRDRDYQQRLQEFNADQKYRGEVLKINQAEEARKQQTYSLEQKDNAVKRVASYFSEIQTKDGSFDFSDKNKVAYVANQLQRDIEGNPYVAEAFGHMISTRTNGKYDRGRFVPGPNGFVVEMSNSKDPNVKGVMTDNASTDPNDPVTQLAPDQVMSFVDLAETARYHGASPAALSMLLDSRSLELTGASPEAIQQGQYSASQATGSTPQPLPVAAPAPSAVAAPTAPAQSIAEVPKGPRPFAEQLGAASRTILDKTVNDVTGFVEGAIPVLGQTIKESPNVVGALSKLTGETGKFVKGFTGGEQPAAPATAPATDAPKAVSTGKPSATRPYSKPETQSYTDYFQGAVGQAIKDTAETKNTMGRLAKNAEVSREQLNRFLLVNSTRGDIPPSVVANLAQNGQIHVDNLVKAYAESPTRAQALLSVSRKGGSGGKDQESWEIYKQNSEGMDKIIGNVNRFQKDSGFDKSSGVVPPDAKTWMQDSALVMTGATDPQAQRDFIYKYGPKMEEALQDMPMLMRKHPDREPTALFNTALLSKFRRADAPANLGDIEAYQDVQYRLAEDLAKKGLSHLTGKTFDRYRAAVEHTGNAKVSVEELVNSVIAEEQDRVSRQ